MPSAAGHLLKQAPQQAPSKAGHAVCAPGCECMLRIKPSRVSKGHLGAAPCPLLVCLQTVLSFQLLRKGPAVLAVPALEPAPPVEQISPAACPDVVQQVLLGDAKDSLEQLQAGQNGTVRAAGISGSWRDAEFEGISISPACPATEVSVRIMRHVDMLQQLPASRRFFLPELHWPQSLALLSHAMPS